MDIQAEKLKLIEWLLSLKDHSIIEKLNFFKENVSEKNDWWETLSDFEKQSIDQGIKDIEEGKTLPHSEVMKKYGRSA
ncbi:MAG: hypothetical protein IPP27_10075 [Bacteroidetes bacterium]|nr:hypothetical protein [Bacteroidota bacterium]MBK8363701.1 hypothetical protein [Bacteroidota bacterium]MBL0032495.1 hypothetical protein [Bacteroidota bacterium]